MKAKFTLGYLFASFCWLIVTQSSAQEPRAAVQKSQRRHLRLRRATQRLQCHNHTNSRRNRTDRYRTDSKDSHVVMAALKKLASQPVRFIIHTEPHTDHILGDFIFSPPAIVIAHQGATESMKKAVTPESTEKRMAVSPEMREAYKGFHLVTPHVEYRDKMTLNVGERTLELYYLKNVHSEADTAIWLPKERVLFTAASVTVNRFGNHRPFVSIPDTLSAIKLMKALNPEVVIPGHGAPGSVKALDDMEKYYNLLMERVGAMVKAGKSLDEIKKELKIPGTEDWEGKDRFPNNIEAAYRAVKGS